VRIAIVAPPWVPVPPPAYGGTEAVVDALARGLRNAGHDVILYATGDSTCPVTVAWTYEQPPAVPIGDSASELRHVIDAYATVEDVGADIVHDHTVVGPVYVERFRGRAVVTTNHGPFDQTLGTLYRVVADRIPLIAISHHQASTAGPVPVAGVIHHGLDLDRFPLGSGRGGYALYLGRMTPHKGVHTAVEVARAAGLPLQIAAKMREREERAYFAERVEPLLGGDVQYLGEVGGDDKLGLLGDACCLLNPIAWDEPFGMVMIEALACGTPVVATPRGAAPEIVDDGVTGFLRSDIAGLAAAVARVGELDRHACRQAVKERFSMTRLAEDHLDLYQRVLAHGRAHPRASAA
jgi:glycosyltransferase involved in cell wall biosynthesis